MIFTITLNPALDKTIKIDDLKIDEVNRVKHSRVDAGGKGINVSKTIKELKGNSIALGFVGGKTGEIIKDCLDDLDIKNDFVKISDETRTNIKIIDPQNNTYTDINESGPSVNYKEYESFEEKLNYYIGKDSIVVLSGSIPKGIDTDCYKKIIEHCKSKEAKVILDADGKLFAEAVKAGPFMVKPNVAELEHAFGITIDSDEKLIKTAKELLAYGVEYVVVSMGGKGSAVISKDGVIKAKGIKVEVKSTVGAGDSMVGALALALEKGYSIEDAIKLGAATSTASVMTEGSQPGKLEVINQLFEKIEISNL